MTILDIITRSKNAWVLYGYLLEKSGGGKDVVSIPQRKIAEELKMPYQQVRTAIDFLLTNAILTQQVTQGVTQQVTQVKGLVMCYKLSSYNLQKIAANATSNATTNATDNANLTQSSLDFSVNDFIDMWNDVCGAKGLSKVKVITKTRKNAYNGRANDIKQSKLPLRETWEKILNYIANDDFCCGKNERGWKANIDYVLHPGKWAGALERAESSTKPTVTLGVGEYLDSQGNRRYKLSNGNSPQVIVPFSAPKRENMDQLWSNQTNTWYYA